MLPIYHGRFLHGAEALLTVLLQVFLGSWVEQVDLVVSMQVVRRCSSAKSQVPEVDVVGAVVFETL